MPETIGDILGGYCKVEGLLGTKQKCLRPSVASWVGIVKWRTYLGRTEVPETIGGILVGYCKMEGLFRIKQKCLRPSVASWVGIVKWRTY